MPYVSKDRNATLDAFRGMAALCVVGSHFIATLGSGHFPSADNLYSQIGSWFVYLFRGSSIYFFVISGFILSSKVPEWNRQPQGIMYRGIQRMARILVVFWCSLLLILALNLVKYVLSGKAWVNLNPFDIFAEFLLINNLCECKERLIPPGWYLEADFVIFLAFCLAYRFWSMIKIPDRNKVRPWLWWATIPITYCSLSVEIHFAHGHGAEAPLRGLGYFLLGVLAAQSKRDASALVSLAINAGMYLYYMDVIQNIRFFCINGSAVLAFFLACSQMLPHVNDFFSKRIFKWLNDWNFSLFLFNYFVLTVGISLARHFAPNSVSGLLLIMVSSVLGLLLLSAYYFRYVQTPLLRKLDSYWETSKDPKSVLVKPATS